MTASHSNSNPGPNAFVDWLFRDRRTGEITIVQTPNLPLALFLVAAVLRWIVGGGTAGTVLDGVAIGALVVWAADELIRGVNPWRRILGGTVLVVQLVGLIFR